MQKINYEIIDNDNITFLYAGHTFSLNLDDEMRVSADDDGSVTFDPRCIIEINEKNQTLLIEED